MSNSIVAVWNKFGNFLVDLFKGNVRLWITYWVFGVLINGLISYLLRFWLSDVGLTIPHIKLQFYLIIILGLLLAVFFTVAIWRSANKHQGRRVWRILAKIMVVLGVVIHIGSYALLVHHVYDIREKIRDAHKEKHRFSKLYDVKEFGKKINMFYQLEVPNLSKEVQSKLRQRLVSALCNNTKTAFSMFEGYSYYYHYNTKNKHPIFTIEISNSDCKQ